MAAAETVAAAALRRAALTGEDRAVARPVDLESVPAVLRGKLEFASGEEGREAEHLEHLLRRATADTARRRLRGVDLNPLAEAVAADPGAHRGAGRRRSRWWPRCRGVAALTEWPPGSARRAPRIRARWPAPPSWRWSCCS